MRPRAAQASSDTFLTVSTGDQGDVSKLATKDLVYQMCRQTWQESIYITTCLYDGGTHATGHVWGSQNRFVESAFFCCLRGSFRLDLGALGFSSIFPAGPSHRPNPAFQTRQNKIPSIYERLRTNTRTFPALIESTYVSVY